ncbi:MAG TPA: TetR/AcrR family transcriptional regulator [Afifellaceae bacterium]|nr:TetR/AcrR family transcriptional regulator [Afifellaceae bacterium]
MPEQMAYSRRSDANREHLVNAAADLFWKKGYTATSLADIARQSGVPLGNVYYYFKTKAAIAEAVGQLLQDQTRDALEAVSAENTTTPARLTALFRLFAAANPVRAQSGCPIATACRNFEGQAPDAAKLAGEAFALMRHWIAENLASAGHTPKQAQHLADDWLARWQGGITLAHAMNDRALLDRVTDTLVEEAGILDP